MASTLKLLSQNIWKLFALFFVQVLIEATIFGAMFSYFFRVSFATFNQYSLDLLQLSSVKTLSTSVFASSIILIAILILSRLSYFGSTIRIYQNSRLGLTEEIFSTIVFAVKKSHQLLWTAIVAGGLHVIFWILCQYSQVLAGTKSDRTVLTYVLYVPTFFTASVFAFSLHSVIIGDEWGVDALFDTLELFLFASGPDRLAFVSLGLFSILSVLSIKLLPGLAGWVIGILLVWVWLAAYSTLYINLRHGFAARFARI